MRANIMRKTLLAALSLIVLLGRHPVTKSAIVASTARASNYAISAGQRN